MREAEDKGEFGEISWLEQFLVIAGCGWGRSGKQGLRELSLLAGAGQKV